MNFFKSQDVARRNTGTLVLLFVLAVIALVAMTNLLLMFSLGFFDPEKYNSLTAVEAWQQAFDWQLFFIVGAAVIVVVGLGSLYKIISLAGGGARVAEMLDAELIVSDSGEAALDKLNRQKILNVVEEMAIASGTPVPPVYLLDEDGINAFAAGYAPGDAVIGITRGAIEQLSREQLQGVIAHEFSHILNGDMRLNIRLIGILHGIMLLGMIGYYILRGSSRGARSKNAGGIVLLGIGLMVIGYAGTFFGNLIKAAVSRQREYLADASAVQFTRNPNGIAGALKRIGGNHAGSLIENPNGSEISHALFSQGIKSYLGRLYATHPPLQRRILRIEPGWNGEYDYSEPKVETDADTEPAPQQIPIDTSAAAMAAIAAAMTSDRLLQQVGQPGAQHLDYARTIIHQLPQRLHSAVHDPFAARAVLYYLLLDSDASIRERQLQQLKNHADSAVYDELIDILQQLPALDSQFRLPLVDLALPTLRQLSRQQYRSFRRNLDALIETDGRINMFEWAVQKIVSHHLDAVFQRKSGKPQKHVALKQNAEACSVLLSVLAYSGKPANVENVFDTAANELPMLNIQLLDSKQLSLDSLNHAVDRLARLKPLQKPMLLKACARCITADRQITPLEAELFRAIADSLDCPMPPLLLEH